MRFAVRCALLTVVLLLCSAHIGSPDAWYEGPAGPYQVLVHVQAPPVVPGIAIVNIRPTGPGITQVTAFVDKEDATGGSPPPDNAPPVAGQPGWYRTPLWVMSPGSNSVTVAVHGANGVGKVVVPIVAVPSRRLGFDTPLAALLITLAVFLATGMFSIIAAAVRESVLPPGVEPDASRLRRARHAKMRFAVVLVLIVTGTTAWWRAEDAAFQRSIFRPLDANALLDGPRLRFVITDATWLHRNDPRRGRRGGVGRTGLLEDHGKLMHVFVVSSDGKAAFAHLHPVTSDSVEFTAQLPPLPPGNYNVFGDIVHETGLAETLQASLTIASTPVTTGPPDADDSWSLASKTRGGDEVTLDDGSRLRWIRDGAPTPGAEAGLRFVVDGAQGDSARLEPYMGMAGHAVVVRDDGKVFIHLHPLGTISMAAQAHLMRDTSHVMTRPASVGDTIYFPYAFPQSGNYAIWVQFKRAGRVMTASFPARVE